MARLYDETARLSALESFRPTRSFIGQSRSHPLPATCAVAGPSCSHASHPSAASPLAGLLATGLHTTAYLAVTGLIAWVVYRKLGLALLRKAWLNLDIVWAAALVVTGLFTLLL